MTLLMVGLVLNNVLLSEPGIEFRLVRERIVKLIRACFARRGEQNADVVGWIHITLQVIVILIAFVFKACLRKYQR